MDVSFNELRSKEIINLSDGSRMGHMIDLIFNNETGTVLGLMVPGEKRFFKKSEDFFIPLEKVRRIGDDVILVRVDIDSYVNKYRTRRVDKKKIYQECSAVRFRNKDGSYIRYRRLDNKKYK